MMPAQTPRWWKETFVYQIYPRSFQDSNGDGIGDLPGITRRLDYLKNLGVETLWLSPIYKSPNYDNGYDVADYCDIMDEFGTMADFDEMLAGLKERGIRLILDLVVNHSSMEHEWFRQARSSRDNPYREYYIWREGRGNRPPNNWESIFGGPAWTYNEATDDWYLHLFTPEQPDLNWENPTLRQEVYKAMRFWLDKGIDGYRMDVIPFISKRPGLPDIDYDNGQPALVNKVEMYANGPRLHEYLQEMHREVMAHYDCMTVGEGIGVTPQEGPAYVAPARKELDMVYYFDHMYLDRDFEHGGYKDLDLPGFKQILTDWDKAMVPVQGWNTFYLGNHDQPRCASRYGGDGTHRVEVGKLISTLLFTLPVTPYIYQGDEFGMVNLNFTDFDQIDDVDTRNQWAAFREEGKTMEEFLVHANQISRDHARSPIQWSNAPHAGFTEGTRTWLMVNDNYPSINAEAAMADEDSIYHYYRKAIALRKASPVLVYGSFDDLAPEHEQVFVYRRTLVDQAMLILLNMSQEAVSYTLPTVVLSLGEQLLGNYPAEIVRNGMVNLRPFEARVYRLT